MNSSVMALVQSWDGIGWDGMEPPHLLPWEPHAHTDGCVWCHSPALQHSMNISTPQNQCERSNVGVLVWQQTKRENVCAILGRVVATSKFFQGMGVFQESFCFKGRKRKMWN